MLSDSQPKDFHQSAWITLWAVCFAFKSLFPTGYILGNSEQPIQLCPVVFAEFISNNEATLVDSGSLSTHHDHGSDTSSNTSFTGEQCAFYIASLANIVPSITGGVLVHDYKETIATVPSRAKTLTLIASASPRGPPKLPVLPFA